MDDRSKFIVARWAYGLGQPIISDAEYNVLLDRFKATDPNWEYVTRSWSSDPCPTELLKSIGREDLISAIVLAEKTESIPSLNSWYEIEQEYVRADYTELFVSYKHDGWNIQASYYNGKLATIRTRGRAADALDADVLRPIFPESIPVMGKVKVIGECTCSKELFVTMKQTFDNALERSAVRTAMARPEYARRLSFHAFDIQGYIPTGSTIFGTLVQWGFKVPQYKFVSNYEELIKTITEMGEQNKNYPYPTDGLVARTGSYMRAMRVGEWEEPIYSSYVTGYEQSYGGHTIAMKVRIKPIHTVKGMQRRISITNLSRIVENNLRVGYPIAFKITSSAYGDIDEESTRALQAQWKGKEITYCNTIDRKEETYDKLANSGELGHIQTDDVV